MSLTIVNSPGAIRGAMADELPALVRSVLPEPLRGIAPGKTTRAEARRAAGAPSSTEGPLDYYELAGVRFDTTISYSGQRVALVIHRFAEPRLTLQDFEPWVTEQHRRAIRAQLEAKPRAHSGKRSFSLRFPAAGMDLTFDAGGSKPLRTVVLGIPRDGDR